MSVHSAGILLFKTHGKQLEVFLVHPGGPYWEGRDEGAWSIPKGLFEDNEQPLDAARREFREETGFNADGAFIELGQLKQPSRKIIHAWALEQDINASKLKSNTFTLEWPRGSGIMREYPEVDRGEWFGLSQARKKISKGQAEFIERLVQALHTTQARS
jgi:predicted NUDIX family NTP pyrophosphohydrolase